MTAAGTPAMGGQRDVPVPDALAGDYLVLALRLDQHSPGLVDGYFGPADLKARVDMAPLPAPATLRDDADALRGRLEGEVDDPARRDWLDGQLRALRTQAAALAGEGLPYLVHVDACFGTVPRRRAEAEFEEAAAELDGVLPGPGPLAERLAAWDERFTIPPDRVPDLAGWLTDVFRDRARELWGLPAGEQVRVSLVRNQPWSGYNWYDGGLRSRVDLNLDLPIRADGLMHVIAHETYLGHHLEHAWREAEQVMRHGRMEASILLINTPECLISEGLGDLGLSVAFRAGERRDLLRELYRRAGITADADDAARQVAMTSARRRLSESRANAAMMRHADGLDHATVLAYLVEVGRFPVEVAEKRLEFIEHPLWRTYVFVYHEGEALLRRWVEAEPGGRPASRFARLLREPLTPAAVERELAAPTRPS